jgi:hypothetical protein
MKIKEPFLLIAAICWVILSLVPKEIHWRGFHRPVDRTMRVVFVGIGFALLLLWYSLTVR